MERFIVAPYMLDYFAGQSHLPSKSRHFGFDAVMNGGVVLLQPAFQVFADSPDRHPLPGFQLDQLLDGLTGQKGILSFQLAGFFVDQHGLQATLSSSGVSGVQSPTASHKFGRVTPTYSLHGIWQDTAQRMNAKLLGDLFVRHAALGKANRGLSLFSYAEDSVCGHLFISYAHYLFGCRFISRQISR